MSDDEKPGVAYAPSYILPIGEGFKTLHTCDQIDIRLIEFTGHTPQIYVAVAQSPAQFGLAVFLREEGIDDLINLLTKARADIERIKAGDMPETNMLLAPHHFDPPTGKPN